MSKIIPQLKMYPDFYRDKDHSSVTELSRALQSDAKWLSPIVTHLAFNSKDYGRKNFPILAATEGEKNINTITLDSGFEYKYSVLGRPKKTSIVVRSAYTTGDKPGIAGGLFKGVFADRWFYRQQTLYPNGASQLQVRVMTDPVQVSGGWEYTMRLYEASNTLYMPLSCLVQGSVWGGGVSKVPFESSKGVESRSYLPGAATNMISFARSTYKFKGNVQKKIMMFEIPVDGKVFKSYVDWEIYLAEMMFKEQCETDLWWSRYGKNSLGEIMMIDDETSVPVTSGAGIDQQIPPSNTDTYSFLTYNKFFNLVRDVTFNITDELADIHVYTGKGGMQDFDRMIKNELKGFTQLIDSKQYSSGENSYDMVYGSFFTSFRHQDGQMLTVHYHPMFDRGIRAETAPKHPVTGLPLTSHDFYFIDMTKYDGKSNLQYVVENGRQYFKWAIAGATVPVGFPDSPLRATDRDESSVQTMKSQGIQIMRPSSCFKLLCSAS